MTTGVRSWAIGAAALAAGAVVAGAACGKARSSGGNNNGPGVAASANEQVVNPYGFTIQVTGLDIPADPTSAATPPTVTFTLADEKGAPITDLRDELGRAPNGSTPASGYPYINAPRFTLARLGPDGTYSSLYLTGSGGATMATSVTLPRDQTPGGQFDQRVTSNGNGSYTFKLNPLSAGPSSAERGQTWTAGVWASRRPSAQTPADEAASATGNFVPAGGTPTTKQVVALGACNTCHAPAVRAHGTRLGVQLCLTCHTPQTHDPQGTSVEFVELIHKVHYGADRPGPTYTIIGFMNSENTFEDEWINDVRNCTLCHQGANANRHVEAPSQRACTTCHSVVRFDGSAPATCATSRKDAADCNHPAGPQPDTACASCHPPSQLGSAGVHTSIFAIAQGWKYEIKGATVGADGKPTIQLDVLDTSTNQPRDLSSDPSYTDPAASLNVQIGWPSKDYANAGSGAAAPGQPRSIAIVRGGHFNPSGSNVTPVAGQTNVYQVTSPVALPAGVTSYTVFMDGHPVARGENIPVTNAVQTFGVSGGAGDARRTVVSVQSCNVCHGTLSWHGRNRNGSVETCVVCHNPHATDWARRQATPGATGEQSVDFKVLIHGVHSADIRHDPMTVYEFNAANAATGGNPAKPEDFPGTIPHGVANCNMCHVNGSYEPPLSADAQDTTVSTNNTPQDPSDDTTMPKTQAVCTSCHDQAHFDAGSSSLPACGTLTAVNSAACFHTGGAQPSDANCASCHGRGGPFDVTTVHGVH